jgi:hypothetical protein
MKLSTGYAKPPAQMGQHLFALRDSRSGGESLETFKGKLCFGICRIG